MWVARDDNDLLYLWDIKPVLCYDWTTCEDGSDTEYNYWGLDALKSIDKNAVLSIGHRFEIDSDLFPELEWNDDPIEVELVIKK